MGGFGGINIIGTGSFVPEYRIKNDDFACFLDTNDEWITSRTGISERRFHFNGKNSEMAIAAARNALEDSGCFPGEIDYVIVSTSTPDYFYPSLSCQVSDALSIKGAGCLDVNAACTGFVSALDIARSYLALGVYQKILVVASEKLSSHVDFNDRTTAVLFGDGAGAIIAEKGEGIYSSYISSNPECEEDNSLYCKVNYEPNHKFENRYEQTKKTPHMFMDGKAVYKFAVEVMQTAAEKAAEKLGMSPSQFDIIIPHQANIRIIKSAIKGLGLTMDKIYTHINTRANISSACIPTMLDELKKSNRLERGMKICIVAFGAGLTFGSICFEY
ncbi:MAG: beta-ketoacyl-ACP synthase 3 [Eubacterium sp.]|jgi:3-oxoacyl-[acyl-carrier-protein] synthase-3|nr:beta-ketoacyl-ACP synthase 3 [Eubacterium sp.]